MPRTKLILMGLLAVFAASAVVSASASAAPQFSVCKNVGAGKGLYENSSCEKEGGEKEWAYRTLGGTETLELEGTSGVSLLEGSVAKAQIVIICLKDTFKGVIEKEGKTKGEIEFSECQLFTRNKTGHLEHVCFIPNIKFKFRDQLVAGKGHGPEDEFKTGTAGSLLFVEIEFGEPCGVLKGKFKAEVTEAEKGVTCSFPLATFSLVTHEIECTSTGDEFLRFGKEKASFYSIANINLQNGAQWFAE
jgi:hypothetical protein